MLIYRVVQSQGRYVVNADLDASALSVHVTLRERGRDESDVVLSGMVKWDGCSNWFIPSSMHGCGRQDVVDIGQILLQCFDVAVRLGKAGPEGDSWSREHDEEDGK